MFDRAVDFGWFYIITKPLFQILHWFIIWKCGLINFGTNSSNKNRIIPIS